MQMATANSSAHRPRAGESGQGSLAPGDVCFGVVLFDNPRDMSAGWACQAGGEPFRISSAAELSNQTGWVTNLDWAEYTDRAKRQSHLRRADFLRSSLAAIGSDLGVRITGSYAAIAAPLLANVINQAVRLSCRAYGWSSPINDVRECVLVDDIRRTLPGLPKVNPVTRTQMSSAFQSYSAPDWPPEYDDNTLTFTVRYNRLEYAQKIMTTQVPDDAWTYIPPAQAASLSIEDLLNPAAPTLVEAAVELGGIDPDMATLVSFGAQTAKRTGIRKWISQPELAWLSRHARVTVTSALRCRSSMSLPQSVALPSELTEDPLMRLSISAGLVAECHWNALAAKTYSRVLRSDEVGAWGVWLRAADRALSFELALKAKAAGFKVTGYGNGCAVLKVSKFRLRECLEFAEQGNCSHPSFDAIFEEHGIE